ncbi:Uncharacterised protein (plasmid) [Tsukamurella tyrosinosolvens]|uniref:Uncharacterized protein n=1 Tax=Tsukamurella tyrosinosolvens TaxID=57704 RepID=A0A1H4ZW85_TSUTY|nr:hypothetical protein [Tsukamurella tyrosinosolvens]KXO95505.1 hypothetical protein AXK58_12455 [Tsukamurella tyrosinosolvens]SED34359.1 hypothetical protein SAMN04489793_4701 [Tsukamurella tyrosinosolvens]VEH99538.1 Uncharacterised protein [Tsukamurella tyrosinosolvens]
MRVRLSLSLAAGLALCATGPAFAAAPPPGALLGEFAQNQLENCAAICPYALQGAVGVPAGVLAAPGAALAAAPGGPFRAFGAGAAAVTGPADAAMTGIIGNDLNQVVPRFQNGVVIGLLDLMRIGGGTGSVGALRTDLLAALQQPLPPVAPTPPPLTTPAPFGITPAPQGPAETAVVQGTNAFFAAAFYVPELSLLGATQTANAAATTLAQSGDPVAAAQAGLDAAGAVAAENTRILERALTTPSTSGTGAGARSTSSEPADAAGAGAGQSATVTVGATGSDDPVGTSSTSTNSTAATDSTDSAGDGD